MVQPVFDNAAQLIQSNPVDLSKTGGIFLGGLGHGVSGEAGLSCANLRSRPQ